MHACNIISKGEAKTLEARVTGKGKTKKHKPHVSAVPKAKLGPHVIVMNWSFTHFRAGGDLKM